MSFQIEGTCFFLNSKKSEGERERLAIAFPCSSGPVLVSVLHTEEMTKKNHLKMNHYILGPSIHISIL